MNAPNQRIDAFVSRAGQWQDEIRKLRSTLLECGLDEDLKWGKPCFMHEGRNIAIIQPFKAHCALMFFKGTLLEDTHDLLRDQGPNSKAARRLEFTNVKQIRKTVVRSYVTQAIEIEKAGRTVEKSDPDHLDLPEELVEAFRGDLALAKAFDALTPGRRRGWVLHIEDAKQSKTRTARIEKATPKILEGRGPNDR